MGYMSTYKRLDNLCRDCGYIDGVTGYIREMESAYDGMFVVPGWKEDQDKLKYYRFVRNRIAHDNYAEEENLCSDKDTEWVDTFRQRIIDGIDPLTIYRKNKIAPNKKAMQDYAFRPIPKAETPRNPPSGCGTYFLALMSAITLLLLFL